MATSDLEARVVALEQKAAQYAPAAAALVAGNTPKLTTRQAGYITMGVTFLTFLGTHATGLPDWAQGAITAGMAFLTAYETAELT